MHYQKQQGNALDVPQFFLSELDRTGLTAREVLWVCKTQRDARRYSGRGIGRPYQEKIAPHALIVATDGETQTGYLVLQDATRLNQEVVFQFITYRREQRANARF